VPPSTTARCSTRTATARSAARSWRSSAALVGGSIHLGAATDLLDRLVLDDEFAEFLTLAAYNLLD